MGIPLFRVDRRLWLVTETTAVLLLGSMGVAIGKGGGGREGEAERTVICPD